MRRSVLRPALALLAGLFVASSSPATAQPGDAVRIVGPTGRPSVSIEVSRNRGHAAIPASATASAGWRWTPVGDRWVGRAGQYLLVEVTPGLPLARVDDVPVQLAHAPYLQDGELWLPVQLVVDVLPDRFPDEFESPGDGRTVRVLDPDLVGASAPDSSPAPTGDDPPDGTADRDRPARVVIIDPGHGGDDPGAMGPGGEREEDVALGIAQELARALSDVPDLQVQMTRNRDVQVPLWERGARATEIKGDRPGVFISIHANAVSDRRVRGFETYFLSEARTEHEARVAALENSAFLLDRSGSAELADDPDLGFILKELRNFDHQHWSADLAAVVQRRMAEVHPGPNRGVKQGPLAVITNSLMPSVLVEVGFISHPREAATLSDPDFRRDVGRALAASVVEFFERYPPGGSTSPGSRR